MYMSGCLYFPNDIYGLIYDNLQNLFQLMILVFKENLNL